MAEQTNPYPAERSLDHERAMAIQEALIFATGLTPSQREELIRDFEAWIAHREFRDEGDFDDGTLGVPVRRLGPRTPRGQAGATALPEAPFFEW